MKDAKGKISLGAGGSNFLMTNMFHPANQYAAFV